MNAMKMKRLPLSFTLTLALVLMACSQGAATADAPAAEAKGTPAANAPTAEAPAAPVTGPLVPPRVSEPPDADAIVAAQEQVLTRLYRAVLPSVVRIRVTQRITQDGDRPFGSEGGPGEPREFFQRGEGSGFLWDSQGRIVSNYHVVQGASRVTVSFADGTVLEARVLGGDPDSDLAVLQVDAPAETLKPVVLGDSSKVEVGQLAVAIGNPFGQEFTMTTGIVSAVGRTISSDASLFSIPNVIQTDASINPGNSGGPLLDRQGRVIGINTQIITRSGSNSGVGFAVPINAAKQAVPALTKDGRYDYAWLGISGGTLRPVVAELMDLPESARGVLVMEVVGDGPADKGGLRGSDETRSVNGERYRVGGDVIVAIAGSPISDSDDLIVYLIEHSRPGDWVTFDVIREGEQVQVQVTLGTRPRADAEGESE